ncbi:MAG TPA: hypothetical protein VLB46_04940 [Pyrinomonadaceae bacterium]|nr:hypothetical protein [Pyrinomonadaceae bacterium]
MGRDWPRVDYTPGEAEDSYNWFSFCKGTLTETLTLAKFHLNQLSSPRQQAQQLAAATNLDHQALAELWLAIGDLGEAKKHALEAYKQAWGDGEPYVRRYELDKACALLEQLGAPIPDLPPYDPAKDEKLPWEDELVAAVEQLRADTEAKERAKKAQQTNDDAE